MARRHHRRHRARRITLAAGIALLVHVAGCVVGTTRGSAESMGATQHRRQARAHKQEAAAHRELFDPTARASSPLPFGFAVVPGINANSSDIGSSETGYSTRQYNPTARHLEHAAEHQAHAIEHYGAAQELEDFADGRCEMFDLGQRSQCPLIGSVTAVDDVPEGVRLRFAPGVSTSATVAQMRCHHAFAAERAFEGSSRCPLYLPALEIALGTDGRSVIVRSVNPNVVTTLRHRSRASAWTPQAPEEPAVIAPPDLP